MTPDNAPTQEQVVNACLSELYRVALGFPPGKVLRDGDPVYRELPDGSFLVTYRFVFMPRSKDGQRSGA